MIIFSQAKGKSMKEYMSIAQQWANDDHGFAPEVQEEVQTWIEEEQESELEERFGSSLEFGTGGMRGVMELEQIESIYIPFVKRQRRSCPLY